jgi:glyoxylate/hydroxypyruvate reductase
LIGSITTFRGGVINQDDLIEALKNGDIAGAGLDVMTPEPLPPTHELTKMPNVVLTPHIATSTKETRLVMINLVVDNILAGLKDQPMPTRLC